jgi:type III effector protein AvrRpm1
MDPGVYPPSPEVLMTSNNIPPARVLGPKNSDAGANAEVFRQVLADRGTNVSTRRAGELLREVQSDSEDDFA